MLCGCNALSPERFVNLMDLNVGASGSNSAVVATATRDRALKTREHPVALSAVSVKKRFQQAPVRTSMRFNDKWISLSR